VKKREREREREREKLKNERSMSDILIKENYVTDLRRRKARRDENASAHK
jgi:hypothetical protein